MPEQNSSKIVDGGRVVLKCNSCNKRLMEIWIMRPFESITTNVKAKCPYCNGSSYQQTIKGGFAIGGIADSKADEPNQDARVYTRVKSEDITDELVTFIVEKIK